MAAERVVFNEMLGTDGAVRPAYARLNEWLERQPKGFLTRKNREAETIFRRLGITFAVYGAQEATERLIPFDPIPRILSAGEWRRLSAGIDQRVRALNAFLHDIYHRQEIIRAGRIPADLIMQNAAFLPEMVGFTPARRVYSHIIGTDLVRVGENDFYVLEDNTRTPSGVSYMLENRETMMRMFPDLFQMHRVAPIEHYPELLRQTLESVAPEGAKSDPTICILTPGIYNSAYFEHAFLADQMGVELVEGRDLYVDNGKVWMRTTRKPKQVDVIYRRIDDAFLDPLTFRPESMLGVPGLFDAYRAGTVTICNAPGTGIADDKAIYAYVPDIIEFYTGQKPILNNVPTWNCSRPDDLAYVLDNLADIVVKEVHGSGGYGMLIGPTASKREIAAFREILMSNPTNYIAQPTLALSACPTHVASGVAPRHVDLRPFVLIGDQVRITPGGLTRVALKKGSLVVNSSQGGGTKDTWVLED
ncbi:circularly permuted type 2 ATP-grasp protein [Microvirga tunisiensis]|uniref:Circularly permuted type 2 ATP-grasp protein n=2 Tax=Pannonibacter tanglangensis TaxID=2750084 RepID=A0A7X5F2M3_9HYPH|nr:MULTISPECIES: circularly permuted type 2 ATP-grasp protein [unclassified Pannonibacter]NBN63717.1 circularly permuted type 2 ATP-grasp protein [Pannonibacter sp. XCT-34]NBN77364.1 circularly permuted type 2 ATP-grasp protein [Pannonibacter sp. XCT-53]